MWKYLLLSFHILFQPHPAPLPFCSASTILNHGVTIASSHSGLAFTGSSSKQVPSTEITIGPASTSAKSAFSSPDLSSTTTAFASSTITSSSSLTISTISANNAAIPTTTTTVQATQTMDPSPLQDIQTIQARRATSIIAAMSSPAQISVWLSSLGPNGKWPDSEIDYTTGCAARRANWPAQIHWQRILVMSGAWHGGLPGADQFVHDNNLRSAISIAMDYWFGRDFTNVVCLDSGGTAACPCDNVDNSLWNTNWFSNIILIPGLVGQVCLLLNNTLIPAHVSNCTHMTGRAYNTFDRNINGVGTLTGANALDVAKIGIDQALLTSNVSLLTDAYRRVHLELQIKNGVKVDGIRADGSFGQHGGMLYNGNYGKDYTNDVLDLEVAAGGTMFAAESDSQNAFSTLFEGDKWMIFRNAITGVLHWDFSALGRFISFPVVDTQATGSIKINLTEVLELGLLWSPEELINFANDLSKKTSNANAGKLVGNRMFYANDYMVHRGENYVSTVKMYSSRTQNTECTNLQNPKGFHLSDGVLHTYLQGNEYEDIAAAWDWNLIPGITVDYNATTLECGTTQQTGVENFVGGVSDDRIGAAAMRYTNPLTKSLRFQKAWFFLDDDVQHVMISGISSTSNAPILSVLDQKRFAGSLMVDGVASKSMKKADVQTLWHGDVGYAFPIANKTFTLATQFGEKTGAWSMIGTSTQPPATVDLFAAWIEHNSPWMPISYTVFPSTSHDAFIQKSKKSNLRTIQNDQHISGVYDPSHKVAMHIFWDAQGGSTVIHPDSPLAPITITANRNLAVIYKLDSGEVTISDPSQSAMTAQVSLTLGSGQKPPRWGSGRSRNLVFQLPSGGIVGSSVTQAID